MTKKSLIPRGNVDADVVAAIRHYREEAGADLAADFVASLEFAYEAIIAQPGLGSPRFGEQLNLPGLRHRPLKRFPYFIFYVERADHVEIWRVLHVRRDVRTALHEISDAE